MKISNQVVVGAKVKNDKEVVIILKSPCRHYSRVTLELDEENGKSEFYITDVKSRCGIRTCLRGLEK